MESFRSLVPLYNVTYLSVDVLKEFYPELAIEFPEQKNDIDKNGYRWRCLNTVLPQLTAIPTLSKIFFKSNIVLLMF